MIRVKAGVCLDRVSRRVYAAIATADQVYHWAGVDECWITSANDGRHMATSKHSPENNPSDECEAVDLRSKNVPTLKLKRTILADLSRLLDNEWDVILEYPGEVGPTGREHFHAEYDPR